jgi:hypothetical protein
MWEAFQMPEIVAIDVSTSDAIHNGRAVLNIHKCIGNFETYFGGNNSAIIIAILPAPMDTIRVEKVTQNIMFKQYFVEF